MSTTTHPSGRASRRLGALVAGAVAIALTPAALIENGASAAIVAPSQLVLTDVSGARVARGGDAGAVHASVANRGTTPVGAVTVRYAMPTGVEFVPTTSTGGCSRSGEIVTCVLGTIAAGDAAPVDIGVRVSDAAATVGDRPGYFLAPTGNGFDPVAGEVRLSTWYHEAGGQNLPLATCWPIDNPSPNMDIAGDTCDGTNDAPAADPDETAVFDSFPPAYNESVANSWQFDTEITAPSSGQYHACGVLIDDGGYLAITPVGQPFTPSSIRVQNDGYGSVTGSSFTLDGGTRYRVLVRVSNRGSAGIDNGNGGGELGGWTAYGISPASQACGSLNRTVFGSDDRGWVDRIAADVIVVGASDVGILGAVESAPVDGVRSVSVRVGNSGPDATSADVTLRLPNGSTPQGALTGCDRVLGSLTCRLDSLPSSAASSATSNGRVVSGTFSGPGNAGWTVAATSTIDRRSDNDQLQLTPGG